MNKARAGWVLAAVLVLPAQALAQSDATRAAARDLGAEGVEEFQAGRYDIASQKLGRAFEILRVPSLGLWSARALVKVGKLVEASERYLALARLDASTGDAAVQRQAQAEALTERDALLPQIPSLTLQLAGGSQDATVTLDGVPVVPALLGIRQPANPGKHVAEARQGAGVVRREVTLSEGQRLSLTLDLAQAVDAAPAAPAAAVPPLAASSAPAANPPATTTPTANTRSGKIPTGVWVGIAIAGAGLVTGGVTAAIAAGKKSDLDCPSDRCQPSQRDAVDSTNRLLTISTIGFVAAGLGAATAGVFFFTRPREPVQAGSVTPWVGIGAAGVRGAF